MWIKKIVVIGRNCCQAGWQSRNLRSKTLMRAYAEAANKPGGEDGGRKSSSSGSGRQSAITEKYKAAWKQVAPLLDVHKTPTNFLDERPGMPTAFPTKLTVNFVMPSKCELDREEVDMVIIPSVTGMMGLLPGHVPTIAELRPGILSVHKGTETKKYFVSSGFAFMHANSVADVVAVEAVAMENLDVEEARKGLAEYTQKLNSAATDLEKAEAQIALEVYGALVSAIGTAT